MGDRTVKTQTLEQLSAALATKTHVAENHHGNTWSATVYFGEGDEARDAMRLFADAVRTGQLVVAQADERKFKLGDRVTKTKGSNWTGLVVGFYSTSLTPIGYCVESEAERGSVQLYPQAALAANGDAMTEAAKLRPFKPADYIKTPEDLEAYRDAVIEGVFEGAVERVKDALWLRLDTHKEHEVRELAELAVAAAKGDA